MFPTAVEMKEETKQRDKMIEVKNEEFDHYLQDNYKKESIIYRHSEFEK